MFNLVISGSTIGQTYFWRITLSRHTSTPGERKLAGKNFKVLEATISF